MKKIQIRAFMRIMVLERVIETLPDAKRKNEKGKDIFKFLLEQVRIQKDYLSWVSPLKHRRLPLGIRIKLPPLTGLFAMILEKIIFKLISKKITYRPLMYAGLYKYFLEISQSRLLKDNFEMLINIDAGFNPICYELSLDNIMYSKKFIDVDCNDMQELKTYVFKSNLTLYKSIEFDCLSQHPLSGFRLKRKTLLISDGYFSYEDRSKLKEIISIMPKESELIFSSGISERAKPRDQKVSTNTFRLLELFSGRTKTKYVGEFSSEDDLKNFISSCAANVKKVVYADEIVKDVTNNNTTIETTKLQDDFVVIHIVK